MKTKTIPELLAEIEREKEMKQYEITSIREFMIENFGKDNASVFKRVLSGDESDIEMFEKILAIYTNKKCSKFPIKTVEDVIVERYEKKLGIMERKLARYKKIGEKDPEAARVWIPYYERIIESMKYSEENRKQIKAENIEMERNRK